jgi:hypothetical protein
VEYGLKEIVDMEQCLADIDKIQPYSIDVAGGLGEVPPLEVVRAIRNGTDFDVDTLDRIARYMLMNKVTTVKSGNKTLGKPFVVNSLTAPWESYDVFKEYPSSLEFIFNVCQSALIKKSMPPLKDTPDAAAGAAN